MLGLKRLADLTITKVLRLAPGAKLMVRLGANTAAAVEREISLAEIVNLIDGGAHAETLTAARTLLASDSGKSFFLSLAGGFTVTLPAPALGLRFKFWVKTAPTTAYIILTASSGNLLIGGVNELEVDTGDDGPRSATGDTFTFVANVAVVGDWVEMESDGTSWYLTGQTNADGGTTITTAS